jgi:flagellar basal-body rod protein FlgF
MDNSIYIALSRQLALFRDMEVTAGNIANANTTGYSSEHIMFSSYLTKDVNQGNRNDMAFAHDIASFRNTETGTMQVTGNPLDLAINGQGYFVVETPLGTRYTRAGNFQIDGNGTLTSAEGYPVLDNSGQQISFPDDARVIEVGSLGNLKINGEDFATLGVVEFENEQLLERLNSGLYASEITPVQSETVAVIQGSLENSNVQPVLEMTHMIEVSRAVANTAKFVEIMYDLQRKTANTWTQQG